MIYNIWTCVINQRFVSHRDLFQPYALEMKAKNIFAVLRKGKFYDICSNMTRIRGSKG